MPNNSERCLYNNSFSGFLRADNKTISGEMNSNYHGNLQTTTRDSWDEEIVVMKKVVSDYASEDGQIIFEYDIPRLAKRIDVVLLFRGIVFCLEFKTGESDRSKAEIEQVLDYALDLKNFHKLSWDRIIAPIFIAPNFHLSNKGIQNSVYENKVIDPLALKTNPSELSQAIAKVIKEYPNETPVDPEEWIKSPYAPTPTIVEAARALYENHSVENIINHGADTEKTIAYVLKVIEEAKIKNQKSICFVTGVPGAGKTLVGLDVAIKQTFQGEDAPANKDEGAVYLSGNGPLVAVLTEALARDSYKKNKGKIIEDSTGKKRKQTITDARREIGKSIQMIHRYRDEMLKKIKNPVVNGKLEIDPSKAVENEEAGYGEVEHIAIFDEAQRSWTQKRLAEYLKRGGTYGNKLKVPNFPFSEAAFLIWSLDQRKDWATIICLVGGGQEINTGEAGIAEWIKALNEHFRNWKIYISPHLTDAEYAEGKVDELLAENDNVEYSEFLHLGVSLRSFKAEKLSAFVHSVLSFDKNAAELYKEVKENYPLVLTRDMAKAREWLRRKEIKDERIGVLVTKEAARYKPLAVQILPSEDARTVYWFLEDRVNTLSSNYLEDAATEIQVQGLELDYTCVLWDADMRYDNRKWRYYKFDGKSNWREQTRDSETQQELRKYMLNAYRVLLTRARAGMVICVPSGNPNKRKDGTFEDPTRQPEFYDGTYNYLKSIGIDEI